MRRRSHIGKIRIGRGNSDRVVSVGATAEFKFIRVGVAEKSDTHDESKVGCLSRDWSLKVPFIYGGGALDQQPRQEPLGPKRLYTRTNLPYDSYEPIPRHPDLTFSPSTPRRLGKLKKRVQDDPYFV